MKYSHQAQSFVVPSKDIAHCADMLIYAIRQIRIECNLPLTKYKHLGPLLAHDHAMSAIIEAANTIGIDLGARWGNEIDVSNPDDKEIPTESAEG